MYYYVTMCIIMLLLITTNYYNKKLSSKNNNNIQKTRGNMIFSVCMVNTLVTEILKWSFLKYGG